MDVKAEREKAAFSMLACLFCPKTAEVQKDHTADISHVCIYPKNLKLSANVPFISTRKPKLTNPPQQIRLTKRRGKSKLEPRCNHVTIVERVGVLWEESN